MGLRFPPSGFTDKTAARAGVRYASWLRRLAGVVLDGLLVNMIIYLLANLIGFLPDRITSLAFGAFVFLIEISGVSIIYATLCLERLHGQTPGMHLLGIRCVPDKGYGQLSFVQALTRSVCAVAVTAVPDYLSHWIGLIWLLPIVAWLWPLIDSRRKTWWDHLAATIVLDERSW